MKTQKQIAEIPASGVEVVFEGAITRLFFDFTDPEPREEGAEVPADLKCCESVDVTGRSYALMVSAIINDRYDADSNQALIANYELAKDSESGISDEKRAEYSAEYSAYQEWRVHAKAIARIAVAELENLSTAE